MASGSKVFTFDEVKDHETRNDCWVIISGKVYDVTSFLEDHPGGDDVLLIATGKDATDDFEDVGHSDDARDLMKKYYIGEIDSSTIPVDPKKPRPVVQTTVDESSGNLTKILQFLLPLLILGLAYALRSLYSKE